MNKLLILGVSFTLGVLLYYSRKEKYLMVEERKHGSLHIWNNDIYLTGKDLWRINLEIVKFTIEFL